MFTHIDNLLSILGEFLWPEGMNYIYGENDAYTCLYEGRTESHEQQFFVK